MGNIKNKKNNQTTITFIVTKAVYIIGFGILGITICILAFLSITADKHLFSPQVFVKIEKAIIIGYFLSIISMTFVIPYLTARKLKKSGEQILKITENIKIQNLDFEIHNTEIKEINIILNSMDDMRIALKESLEKQWRLEQNRKKQISAIAHDFKTPLTVLKGNMDLIRTSCGLDEDCKEYVEDAQASIKQMEGYINQLLEVSRAEKGYLLYKQELELNSVIDDVTSLLIRIASEKEVSISIEKKEKDIFIDADRILIERLINNIISNAIDFTNSKGIIKIGISKTEEDAIISITDSGPGFSLNALNHGAEQFYMDDSSRGRKNHYGLGLFIAESIVNGHNGTMCLSNDEITKGAKVTIKIPLSKK